MFNKLENIKGELRVVNFTSNANSMTDICFKKKLEKIESEKGSLPIISKKRDLNSHNRYLIHLVNEKRERNTRLNESNENNVKLSEAVNLKRLLNSSNQLYLHNSLSNMNIGCLNAGDNTYLNRMIAERNQFRSKAIQRYKDNLELTNNQQVHYYRDQRMRELQKLPDLNKIQFTVGKKRLLLDRFYSREKIQESKKKPKYFTSRRHNDIILGIEYNKTNLCLARSLQKIESKKVTKSSEAVNIDQQPEAVRKILSRISQAIDEHKIDTKIKKQAFERILSGKKKDSTSSNIFDPDMIIYEEAFKSYYK